MEEERIKQVIIVRQDLKLPKGKLAAQVAHASILAYMRADVNLADEWTENGMAKIVLKIEDEKNMLRVFQDAKEAGLKPSLITDAGRTVIAPGTKTCIGIGPAKAEDIDELTGELKLM